jgi:pyrroline-5-carboxylate reductase
MLKKKIGVLGAGKMGPAIIRGVIHAGLVDKGQVMASEPRDEARELLARELGVKATADNREVCDFADVIILAVKPQIVPIVLDEVSDKIGKNKIVVSIAAGVPTSRIEARLQPGARVIRVMPNTPCIVGAAASAYAPGKHASQKDLEEVGIILGSVGLAVRVEERHLDAVTGLSGSGPAYVFLFMESLVEGGVQAGLGRQVALDLAMQTVYGAAKLAMESDKALEQLREEVTSPGGTTLAGLQALEKGNFRGTVIDTVLRATDRSRELGKAS